MTKIIFEKTSEGRKGSAVPEKDINLAEISIDIDDEMKADKIPDLPELSELDVIRHYTELANKNICVNSHFYPLGSCTMKYNPCVNEEIASMRSFTDIHPYQVESSVNGNLEIMYLLKKYLCELTGMDDFTLQPAAGAHGEFTAMLMTKKWFELKKENRNKILIPDSAHGTNPASANMAGFEVVQIASNENGTVNLDDLETKIDDKTACFMMTNPNTLGLFEKDILKISEKIHSKGGLLYYDGANLNAILGLVRPGDAGFDFVHLNMHKTFSTPHGGGGPGAGPVGAKGKLADCLPLPKIVQKEDKTFSLMYDNPSSIGRVKAFYGNFLVLVKALAYILSLGKDEIANVAKLSVLNANYLLKKLEDIYEIPYGKSCMHEFVASADRQKEIGITAIDICKRMLDYGFHAPTVYFPLIVHEALMIEPTETESIQTLDLYAEILHKIQEETEKNPDLLHEAPHNMPVKRLDDVTAARKPDLAYKK